MEKGAGSGSCDHSNGQSAPIKTGTTLFGISATISLSVTILFQDLHLKNNSKCQKQGDVLTTNEMHNSYNQFLFHRFFCLL
jgi:uncharacterized sporulation protein YeaH/YhbH (DUF444 family)